MVRNKTPVEVIAFRRARRLLAGHDPVSALPHFRAAVAGCSAAQRAKLGAYLYWLAIALRRLARQPLAVKALDSASQLTPRGYIRRSFLAITNGYGQPKCLCEEHDDYRAFFTIQVRRYLATVPGQKFFDATEMEAVLGIIAKAWLGLQRQPDAAGWSCGQKLEFFKNIRVVFPVLRNRVSGSGQQVISFINGLPKLGSVKIRRLPMPWEDRI